MSNNLKTISNESSVIDLIIEDFSKLNEKIQMFKIYLQELQMELKKVEKDTKKKVKSLERQIKKKTRSTKNKKPSGFAKPMKLSNELCGFLNKQNGTKMARTQVTKELIKYIKENKLQNPENKKNIIPDKKLKSLLEINENDNLNYFNIQSFMNKHFI